MLFRIPSFWKNASLALIGTLLYQLLPVAVLPIITRLLDSGEIGLYFTWLGVVAIFSVVLTLRLDMAVLQAGNERQGRRIVEAIFPTIVLLGFLFFVLGVICFWFYFQGVQAGFYMVYLISCSIASVFNALNLMVNALLVRGGRFKEQAAYKILLGVGIVFFQGVLVFFYRDAKALVLGYMLAVVLVTVVLLSRIGFNYKKAIRAGVVVRYKKVPERYQSFIRYSLPAALINMVAQYLPLFFINGRMGPSAAGYYGLTQRTLSAPLGLVGGSILSAFREESARRVRSGEGCFGSYLYTLKALACLGVFPFLVLGFYGSGIFAFAFGDDWAEAGLLASYLAPMFFVRFLASPLSFMFFLLDKQRQDLIWQGCFLLMTAAIFLLAENLRSAVLMYSACSALMYLVNLFMSYLIARSTRFGVKKIEIEQ